MYCWCVPVLCLRRRILGNMRYCCIIFGTGEMSMLPAVPDTTFFASSWEKCSGRILILEEVGSEDDE